MRSVFGDIHIRATLRFGVGYFLSHSWRRLWRAFFNPSRQVAINDIARVYCRTSGRHEIGRGLVSQSDEKSRAFLHPPRMPPQSPTIVPTASLSHIFTYGG